MAAAGSSSSSSGSGPHKPEGIDDLSLQLAISLQLADVESVLSTRKGKGREGDFDTLTDKIAFDAYKTYLEAEAEVLADHRMARSYATAMMTDFALLAQYARVEIDAARDRKLAMEASGMRIEDSDEEEEIVLGRSKGKQRATTSKQRPKFSATPKFGSEDSDEEEGLETESNSGKKFLKDNNLPALYKDLPHGVSIPKLKCVSCLEMRPSITTVTAPCNDLYCRDCIRTVFTNAIMDEELYPPRCCKQEITIDHVWDVLTDEEITAFFEKSEEYSCKSRIYCSYPQCSAFIPAVQIVGDVATCDKCGYATCTMCKKGQHRGDCPKDKELTKTLELGAKAGWQRCKKCYALVELAFGCQHMTCRCKAEWCYRCGADWKTCKCSDWDAGLLNRRAEELAIRDAGPSDTPAAIKRRTHEVRNRLEEEHECDHTVGWNYQAGRFGCEMCQNNLDQYIFVCRGCLLAACNRCRKNRV